MLLRDVQCRPPRQALKQAPGAGGDFFAAGGSVSACRFLDVFLKDCRAIHKNSALLRRHATAAARAFRPETPKESARRPAVARGTARAVARRQQFGAASCSLCWTHGSCSPQSLRLPCRSALQGSAQGA